MKLNILGTEYDLIYTDDDIRMETRDGFTDSSVKKCVVSKFERIDDRDNIANMAWYKNRVARHEIIHAFLTESGLSDQCDWATEEMVDWLAMQFPKLNEIFQQAEIER